MKEERGKWEEKTTSQTARKNANAASLTNSDVKFDVRLIRPALINNPDNN